MSFVKANLWKYPLFGVKMLRYPTQYSNHSNQYFWRHIHFAANPSIYYSNSHSKYTHAYLIFYNSTPGVQNTSKAQTKNGVYFHSLLKKTYKDISIYNTRRQANILSLYTIAIDPVIFIQSSQQYHDPLS